MEAIFGICMYWADGNILVSHLTDEFRTDDSGFALPSYGQQTAITLARVDMSAVDRRYMIVEMISLIRLFLLKDKRAYIHKIFERNWSNIKLNRSVAFAEVVKFIIILYVTFLRFSSFLKLNFFSLKYSS